MGEQVTDHESQQDQRAGLARMGTNLIPNAHKPR